MAVTSRCVSADVVRSTARSLVLTWDEELLRGRRRQSLSSTAAVSGGWRWTGRSVWTEHRRRCYAVFIIRTKCGWPRVSCPQWGHLGYGLVVGTCWPFGHGVCLRRCWGAANSLTCSKLVAVTVCSDFTPSSSLPHHPHHERNPKYVVRRAVQHWSYSTAVLCSAVCHVCLHERTRSAAIHFVFVLRPAPRISCRLFTRRLATWWATYYVIILMLVPCIFYCIYSN